MVIKEACYVMDSLKTKCPKLQIACHHDSAVFFTTQKLTVNSVLLV